MVIVIFDVGNVVIKADHSITHQILVDYGVPQNRAKTFFENYEYKEFGRGNLDEETFYRVLIGKYLKFQLPYESIVKAHDKHLYGVDKGVVGLLSKLPRGNLAFSTNTNVWQTRREQELIDLRKYSPRIFRSHEIHLLKTDNGCFQYLVSQLKTSPSDTLFVDDKLENTLEAQKHGLQTHHFKSVGQLAAELKRRNLV